MLFPIRRWFVSVGAAPNFVTPTGPCANSAAPDRGGSLAQCQPEQQQCDPNPGEIDIAWDALDEGRNGLFGRLYVATHGVELTLHRNRRLAEVAREGLHSFERLLIPLRLQRRHFHIERLSKLNDIVQNAVGVRHHGIGILQKVIANGERLGQQSLGRCIQPPQTHQPGQIDQ